MHIFTPYNKFAPAIRDVANYPCPVSTLPTELLQEIFAFSMTKKPRPRIMDDTPEEELRPTGFNKTALFLTWVCSQWRQIALAMPELWGTMTIYKPKKYSVELVKGYLSRSGNSTPLDLSLCQGPVLNDRADRLPELFPEHEVTVDILKLWVPLAHRWRCIDFDMSFTPPLHEFPNILPDALSSLQEARLHFMRCPGHSRDVLGWLWGNIFRSPVLRVADWDRLPREDGLSPPFSQLHALYLSQPTPDQLFSILPLCGQLKRLHICHFGSRHGEDSILPLHLVITLPRLESLKVDVGDRFPNLLDYIIAPTLQELFVLDTSNLPFANVHSLENLLSRSKCTLGGLHLHEREGDETRTIQYLCHASKHLTALHSLTLSWKRLSERVISLLTPHMPGHVPFPSLLALQLRDTDTRDGIISSMVESRSGAGAPLRSFRCGVELEPTKTSGYPQDKAAFERLRHEGLQLSWFVWDENV